MASLEVDKLVLFYYLSTSEIWIDRRGGLLWKWHYKRGGKRHNLHIFYLHHVRNINSDIDLFYICLCQSNVKFDVETEGKKENSEKEI